MTADKPKDESMAESDGSPPPFRFSLIHLIVIVSLIGFGAAITARKGWVILIVAVITSALVFGGACTVYKYEREQYRPHEPIGPSVRAAFWLALITFLLFAVFTAIPS